jgi:uncharacterized membrane protein
MATLTVWKFGTAGGAQNVLSMFERLQKEELIRGRDRRQQHLRVADERSTASVALLCTGFLRSSGRWICT